MLILESGQSNRKVPALRESGTQSYPLSLSKRERERGEAWSGKQITFFWSHWPILEPVVEPSFKTLADMYHKGQLTKEIRESIRKNVRDKKEHTNQRHFKLNDGSCIDLIALQEEVLDNDRLFLVKLPVSHGKRRLAWQKQQ